MPKLWKRSEKQEEYLNIYVSNLAQARRENRLECFKNDLYEGWFKSWPEEAEVFGKTWKKGDPITLNDMRTLGTAIEKRKEQLYNYVRWHAGGKTVHTQTSGILKQFINKERKLVKCSRRSHKLELYSQRYYETHFKCHVDQELADTTPPNKSKKEFQKRKMTIYRKWRSLSWQMESDEVKAEIEALWNDKNTADENSGDNEDADDGQDLDNAEQLGYRGCLDQLGGLLTSFLRELQEETGWAFTVLGGGLNREGEVKIVVSHVGKTATGKTFPEVCNKYQDHVLQEFYTFVNILHPIEERLHAQVNNEQNLDTQSQDNDTLQTCAIEKPDEQEGAHQCKETTGAMEISKAKRNPCPPTKKGKHLGKGCAIADEAFNKPTDGMIPKAGTGVDSRLSEPALDIPIQTSATDPSTLTHIGAVPALMRDESFQSASLPLLHNSTDMVVASIPSLGYTASSTASFRYSTPTTSGLYLHDVPYASPLASPIMRNLSIPYEDLSPMSKFLARIDPNHEAFDPTLASVSSSDFYDTSNMMALTTMGSTPVTATPLTGASFLNPVLPNMNLQLHAPFIPNQAVLAPRDTNSNLYLDLDPTLPGNSAGISTARNECVDDRVPMETRRAASTLLTSEPENWTTAEANNRQGRATALVPILRKRTRKEVDTTFVLPEGTTRTHKPRQMADDTCWEGPARKRSRNKV